MNVRRLLSASCFGALLLGAPIASATTTITVWVPAELAVNPATTRIATISKTHAQVKFSKACAKVPGKFETWTSTIFDPGLGTTHVVEVAAEKLPGKGLSMDLSSLRADGECTEGKQKWRRFTAVLTEPAPGKPTAKEKPKPDEKKKDK